MCELWLEEGFCHALKAELTVFEAASLFNLKHLLAECLEQENH